MRVLLGLLVLVTLLIIGCQTQPVAPIAGQSTQTVTSPAATSPAVTSLAKGGFDEYGYNNTARLFNGTGKSWSLAKGLPADYLGIYAPDKLVMKWNAEWDRGNDEGWSNPPYEAWEDNEWNGMAPGGSGAVWHYKIKWVGAIAPDGTVLPDGGYMIWGQFEVVMDQGKDPSIGPGHIWFAHAMPTGYRFP